MVWCCLLWCLWCNADIDECSNSIDLCNDGECVNNNGSYTCDCDAGYTGDSCDSGKKIQLALHLSQHYGGQGGAKAVTLEIENYDVICFSAVGYHKCFPPSALA